MDKLIQRETMLWPGCKKSEENGCTEPSEKCIDWSGRFLGADMDCPYIVKPNYKRTLE